MRLEVLRSSLWDLPETLPREPAEDFDLAEAEAEDLLEELLEASELLSSESSSEPISS